MKATLYTIVGVSLYKLAIVARPRGEDWLRDELAALSEQGVEVLVSMLTAPETKELGLAEESGICAALSMKFLNIPIDDGAVPSDLDSFLRHVDQIVEILRQGHSVGVHCRASIGRSSVLAASALVRLGWKSDQAFAMLEKARGCSVPDTPEQRRWVTEHVRPQAS